MSDLLMFSVICTPQHHAFEEGGDLWCFDYTFEDSSLIKDEPLMPAATKLINKLLERKYKDQSVSKIEVIFSSKKWSGDKHDLTLYYVRAEDDGSIYFPVDIPDDIEDPEDLEMEIWLCPVFDQFFPEERPEKLYVTINKVEENYGSSD